MTYPSSQPSRGDLICHATATGIVLHEGRVLLVEHRKSGLFLGPGGHIDNEDPARAVLREIREEVGIEAEIIADNKFAHPAVRVVPSPFTVLVVDIPNDTMIGPHQHVDMVYVCRPLTHHITAHAGEIGSYRWVHVLDVASLQTPPEYPALVAAAAQYADDHCTSDITR